MRALQIVLAVLAGLAMLGAVAEAAPRRSQTPSQRPPVQAPAPSPLFTPPEGGLRLLFVTRQNWREEGWVAAFIDLAGRRRTGDEVTYYAAYVLESPRRAWGSAAPAKLILTNVTVRCRTMRYRFNGSVIVGPRGEIVGATDASTTFNTVDPANASDLLEIRTACTPPEPPPRRHVFETLDAAMRYADSIRAVPV